MHRSVTPMFYRHLAIGILLTVASSRLTAADSAPSSRPNIVLILADDLGYADIGCYGSEIHTPNLDALARDGLRYTQFYNTGRCCPSRASLLTGLYPHQAGMGWMTDTDDNRPGYRGNLNRVSVTLAEVLRPTGYGTYMVGKWHVSHGDGANPEERRSDKSNWPLQRGFERYYGIIEGAANYFRPSIVQGNDRLPSETLGKDYYLTDKLSEQAARFITEHSRNRPDAPFFLYVAFTAPHFPLQAPAADIARYREGYRGGWDALREARRRRMQEIGFIARDWAIAARDPLVRNWDELSEEKKIEMDLRMAIYAAQVDRMDQGIGQIVAALKQTASFENTLILFLSDNGGTAEGGPLGLESNQPGELGSVDSFATYGRSWASASNTPFREYKHWVHEGGIATPFVVHWPAGFSARGQFRDRPGHLIDVMATVVDVAHAHYPLSFDGHDITPLEGISLAPSFARDEPDRGPLFWEHEGNRAVRLGRWKLVAKGIDGPWELYDLQHDRTEARDLAREQPDRLRDMAAMWQNYAQRTQVIPIDPRIEANKFHQ